MILERLIQELIDFLDSLDFDKLYDDTTNGSMCYPLVTDILMSGLVVMEYRHLADQLEYQIMGQVASCLLAHDEDSCKISPIRIKACLGYVEKLIKTQPKKSDNFMYM